MLYIMESQLAALLLKPRRPISCLCMSGRGPHPRTPSRGPRTRSQPTSEASSGTSSRRYHRRREASQPASPELLSRVLVGFHHGATPRQRNAEADTFTGNRERGLLSATVKAIFRQSSSLYREYVISGPSPGLPPTVSNRFLAHHHLAISPRLFRDNPANPLQGTHLSMTQEVAGTFEPAHSRETERREASWC